jgi:hypothetical protein
MAQIAVPALIVVVGLAFISYTYKASPTKPVKQITKVATNNPTNTDYALAPNPLPPSTPTPSSSTTPTTSNSQPVPTVVKKSLITTGTKSLPVVVPVPSSSVSTLTPTTPSSGSGTGSSSSSSSPATTTGYTSTNWSGYLSTIGSYSRIAGSWNATSPTEVGTRTSADGTWIGIGGVTSGDLIQVGTDNFVSPGGQVSSSAFYEMLPANAVTIPSVTINPGDSISASVTETSSGEWMIAINNNTNGQSFSTSVAYTSTNSSAEWIEEDPSMSTFRQYPFDNFGTASFTNGSTTSSGANQTIAGSSAQPVTLVNQSNQPIATPSAIRADGESFSVTHD